MNYIIKNNRYIFSLLAVIICIVLLVNLFLMMWRVLFSYYDIHIIKNTMDERRLTFISEKDAIIKQLLASGDYMCCLEKPCTSCIKKTSGHGEGATCSCLEDVMNGVHPCGECIGKILEGHGNKFLAPYFAKAISEKVGMDYLVTFKQIISEKYNISIQDQS